MGKTSDRDVLRHYVASIAYHFQKAVRGAPPAYWAYAAGNQVRTPKEIVRHMTSVLCYARHQFGGSNDRPALLPTPEAEIIRFHGVLADLAGLLGAGSPLREIGERHLLQGPFSDVMTHIGQLSLLRRLSGSPVPPEDFVYADISAERLYVEFDRGTLSVIDRRPLARVNNTNGSLISLGSIGGLPASDPDPHAGATMCSVPLPDMLFKRRHEVHQEKTDRIDAQKLARTLSTGELRPVYVPSREAQEDRCAEPSRMEPAGILLDRPGY